MGVGVLRYFHLSQLCRRTQGTRRTYQHGQVEKRRGGEEKRRRRRGGGKEGSREEREGVGRGGEISVIGKNTKI